ncbi:MAG: sel1 repeat family protein [Alphaproteobacteria bacterium]|nr:sel1 repeat family protein [Alphaproteobacteria bacterium]
MTNVTHARMSLPRPDGPRLDAKRQPHLVSGGFTRLVLTAGWVALLCVASAQIATAADVHRGVGAFLIGNRITAWRELLPAANAGDAQAQFYVGTMYRHGFGTETDNEEGLFWLIKAAKQGHIRAQFVLGFEAIQDGRPADAAPNIVAAAQAGFAPAQYHAGLLFRDGAGAPQNSLSALGWFLQAAEQDYLAAQYAAAMLLAFPPEGIRQDLPAAYRWFEIAARRDYPAAAASRDSVGAVMTRQEIESAQAAADTWTKQRR